MRLKTADMVTIYIAEEYGFRHWVARLTTDEYGDLIRRWETMRGISCLVPVTQIIPQAIELTGAELETLKADVRCHIHECEDSYLEGSSYRIPPSPDGRFWIDGLANNPIVDTGGDCADVLISKAMPNSDLELLLGEVITKGKVSVVSEHELPAMDASSMVIAVQTGDPDWPTRLRFTYLDFDFLELAGEHPHLKIARHLSERLSVGTLTEGGHFRPA